MLVTAPSPETSSAFHRSWKELLQTTVNRPQIRLPVQHVDLVGFPEAKIAVMILIFKNQ